MRYEDWKVEVDHLEAELKKASDALEVYPRNEIGLTPDAVKFSPDYRAAKLARDRAFFVLRTFNERYTRPEFSVRARDERRAASV